MAEIISVRFRSEGKQYYFDPQGLRVRPGVGVIVDTANGIEYAVCVRGNFEIPASELNAPLRSVVRLATTQDKNIVFRNREKEHTAFHICQQKIAEHGLDMKLVSVEYSFEGTKIIFFFTSEGRVDFRGLVKSLASTFHTRIELRQIGIRDEAKMLGGLGICGRPFCCASFLRDFQPVSIKMAKVQSLSLNPTKISGTCGRLMCCLKYEQEAYDDLLKNAPRPESFVETPDGVGDIITTNVLREKVRVRLDDEPDSLKTYHNSEIRVIRSGKGKRPEDYVPPPKAVLESLRRDSISPEEQYRREQAALAAALDEFMAENGGGQSVSEPPVHRRKGGKTQETSAQREKPEKNRGRHRTKARKPEDEQHMIAEEMQELPLAIPKPHKRHRSGRNLSHAPSQKPVPMKSEDGEKKGRSRRKHSRYHGKPSGE